MMNLTKNFVVRELHTGPCVVVFEKLNGYLRPMTCTLDQDYITEDPEDNYRSTQKRAKSNDVVAVFDMEKEQWRSFRLDSVYFFARQRG